jgi:hypothetical protein
VLPLLLLAAAAVALVAALVVLRSFGPGYRVGRLLATVPRVSVDDARRIAAGPRPRYVRVDGRIDAEDEFEDPDHRPLVLRRTRLQHRAGRSWTTFEEGREQVAFTVREGLDAIAVDAAALDTGLVVVPRESAGTAADLGDRAPPGLAPETPVRAIVEQVSSVEHAIVLGVPVRDGTGDGAPRMTAGLGRPLVLTTLEPAEAMRILGGGNRGRARLSAVLLGLAGVLLLAGMVAGVATLVVPPAAKAGSPSPAAGGGTRSPGEGPGLVGDPIAAIAIVAFIAIVSAAATYGYVRLRRRSAAGEDVGETPR